jgi:hypothetical protein
MKMSSYELEEVASVFRNEDLDNLKNIQSLLNKEINYRMNKLDCCVQDIPAPIQIKEEKMNTANSVATLVSVSKETTEERRISFLLDQLTDANYRKTAELRRSYGLLDDERPRTAQELVDRIKDGQFELDEKTKDDRGFFEHIRWCNPKIKKDKVGYEEASKKMEEAHRQASRTIILKDQAEGLEALEKFEKAKFH